MGPLDGILVHGVIPIDMQVPYMGRGRGDSYENVLAMCDFDMVFIFVWVG